MRSALAALAVLACVVLREAPAAAEPQWNVFSNVDYRVDDSDTPSAFAVGGVDLFATSSLSPRIHVLSESVLEILPDGVVFDLERIHLDYRVADWLTIRAGRYHLPLGYYSTAYHHAMLFQLTTDRPTLVAFEDDGGMMPAHMIGLYLYGRIVGTPQVELHYDLGVGNGRGQHADDILATQDRNGSKAVVARLTLRFPTIHGLELGAGGYLDRIPGGFTDDAGVVRVPESIDEIIAAVHASYVRHPFRALAEGYFVHHRGRTSDEATLLKGGFAQLGVTVQERYTPYVHVEWVSRDKDDLFFNASGSPVKVLDLRAGLHTGLAATAVLKIEYGYEHELERHQGVAQVAFGF